MLNFDHTAETTEMAIGLTAEETAVCDRMICDALVMCQYSPSRFVHMLELQIKQEDGGPLLREALLLLHMKMLT